MTTLAALCVWLYVMGLVSTYLMIQEESEPSLGRAGILLLWFIVVPVAMTHAVIVKLFGRDDA